MNFESFIEEIKNRIKDFLPGEYEEASVSVNEVKKINETYMGLVVHTEGEHVHPTINLNRYYERYQEGDQLAAVLYDMAKTIQIDVPNMNLDRLMNYDAIKDSLFIRVSNRETNAELLQNAPHTCVEDMAITYHIKINQDNHGVMSTPILYQHLELYGITQEQLHKDALERSPKVNPPDIVNMNDMMEELYREQFEMMGFSEEQIKHALSEMDRPEVSMTVVTNSDRINGAAVMFYPNIMEQLGETMGGNYFVLPSSLHETLVVPDDGNMSYRDLLKMVTEINATEVDTCDKLTDQVYHYDVTDKVFEKASSFESRQKEKSHERKSILEKLEEKRQEVKEIVGPKNTSCREQYSL